ncbi:YegS/Rv2252/BmrU family lipid kinase [Anaerococcus sp. AGMB09787]|uniref:diacylglycerol/lipid kinase family protein n=1 Tax=Anaerococcus sp. AGMB09787 TaxID=2922869 RepID=UPI001FAFDD4C|nr:YegS/Rv2252/BmrU family lipid kinase [Anaerococcus sp. AGMB09787]
MKNILFIYNPNSGQQKLAEHLPEIINYLSSKGLLASVYATQDVGDGRKVVQKYGKDYEKIIVSGGDGTLDEIISGALKSDSDPIFAYIPTGSTNDFASSLEISLDIEEATTMAVEGQADPIDVGKIDDKYFVYVAAFGTISDVSFNTDQGIKNVFGRSAYVFEGLRKALPLQNMDSYQTEVEIDGELIEGDLVHFMITNSYSVGGFKNLMGNNVGLNDGIFELTMIKKPTGLADINKIVAGLTSKKENDMVIFRQGKSFKIKTDKPVAWALDGEYGGETSESQIEILKERIRIINGVNH